MKKSTLRPVSAPVFVLVMVLTAACQGGTGTAATTPIPTRTGAITTAVEAPEHITSAPTLTASPDITPTQAFTPTSLPTFVQPPTPAPPSDEWLQYTDADSGMSFRHPANWYVYLESGYIYITNFRLDSMLLKGHESEKIKIDILATPIDIAAFSSLAAYLEDPEQQPAPDGPVKIASQIEGSHDIDGYEMVRQTLSGLMGNPDATYEVFYVASGGKAVRIVVYGEQWIDVAGAIAGSLVIPFD